jgi:hypothetical protein
MPDGGPDSASRRVVAPVLVPRGGGPWSGRSHRLRRSATPLPPRPTPAEMPDDTAGRVAFLGVEPPADVRPEPPDETATAAAPAPRAAALRGWRATALAALVVVAVFALGMGLLR